MADNVVIPYMSLREAEEQLVAAVLDHGHALDLVLDAPAAFDHLRSENGRDLTLVLNAVLGLEARGLYKPRRCRSALATGATAVGYDAAFVAWLDELWCPWAAVPEYVAALLDTLCAAYRLQDDAYSASRRLLDAPFGAAAALEEDIWLRLRPVLEKRRLARLLPSARPARRDVFITIDA